MTALDAKKVYQNLLKAGFKPVTGDLKYLEYHCNGKIVLYVKTGHGEKQLQPAHLGMMRRQCKLSRKEFQNLAEGRMDASQYQACLESAGYISSNALS